MTNIQLQELKRELEILNAKMDRLQRIHEQVTGKHWTPQLYLAPVEWVQNELRGYYEYKENR